MRTDIVRDARLDPAAQGFRSRSATATRQVNSSMDLTASTGMTAEISEISALWARR
jgi:hypothetical protein